MEISSSQAAMIEHANYGIPTLAILSILLRDIKMLYIVWLSMYHMGIRFVLGLLIRLRRFGIQ